MKTCIIIPCYNEAKRLPKNEFLEFIAKNDFHFCFANDGSSDNTINLLNSIQNLEKEKVSVLNFSRNEGKAETIRKAVLHLYNKYDFLGYFDADLATPLFEIENLQKEFSQNSKLLLVMGSRFKRLGANIERKFSRFFFGRVFATIISSFVLKFPVYDTQCGAKIFSTKIPRAIFQERFLTKWIFDVEILIRLKNTLENNLEKLVLEYPLKQWKEKGGSKIKMTEFLKVPFEILVLKYKM